LVSLSSFSSSLLDCFMTLVCAMILLSSTSRVCSNLIVFQLTSSDCVGIHKETWSKVKSTCLRWKKIGILLKPGAIIIIFSLDQIGFICSMATKLFFSIEWVCCLM
jgi:hypothetical protein